MKKVTLLLFSIFHFLQISAQELSADDRLTITQLNRPYTGVFTFNYQGLTSTGYPQFQLNNYGGTPNYVLPTADSTVLGSFTFSGHNGIEKKTVGIFRVRTMENFDSSFNARMDFQIGPNSQQRMTILGSNGNIGIGIDIPEYALDIQRRYGKNAILRLITDHNDSGNAQIIMQTNTNHDDNFHIRKVGINSGGKITNFSIPISNMTLIRNTANSSGMMLGNTGPSPFYLITNNRVGFYMAGDQKIGLGTITPESRLHIKNGDGPSNTIINPIVDVVIEDDDWAYIELKGGSFAGITFNDDNESIHAGMFYDYSRDDLYFKTNGVSSNKRLLIDEDGHVGINIDYPSHHLDVNGQIRMRPGAFIGYVPVSNDHGVMSWSDPNTLGINRLANPESETSIEVGNGNDKNTVRVFSQGNESMTIAPDGKTGLNQNKPTTDLHVKQSEETIVGGTGGITLEESTNSNKTWRLFHSGRYLSFNQGKTRVSCINPTDGTWIRFINKDVTNNISEMASVLDKVMKLKPLFYELNSDNRKRIGMQAEITQTVFPEIVHEGENGELGMDYSASGIIAIKAIQEQQTIIENQADELNKIKEENEALKDYLIQELKSKDEKINALIEKIEHIEKGLASCCLDAPSQPTTHESNVVSNKITDAPILEQNAPNPFNQETIINYYLPKNSESATIIFSDLNGKVLKSVDINHSGFGQVKLNARELAPGTYVYSLFIHGKRIDSKQMVLVK